MLFNQDEGFCVFDECEFELIQCLLYWLATQPHLVRDIRLDAPPWIKMYPQTWNSLERMPGNIYFFMGFINQSTFHSIERKDVISRSPDHVLSTLWKCSHCRFFAAIRWVFGCCLHYNLNVTTIRFQCVAPWSDQYAQSMSHTAHCDVDAMSMCVYQLWSCAIWANKIMVERWRVEDH